MSGYGTRLGTSRLTATELRQRSVKSRVTLRKTKFPDAAAAGEQLTWLSWMDLGGAAHTTLWAYSWTSDRLLREFPDTPFSEIGDAELLHVIRTFPPGSRPRSRHVFASWFKWGVRTKRIQSNPCDFLPDFKKQLQPIVEIFTVEEEAALRALPEPNGTLLALLFDTGLRKAEARLLTRKRIDFSGEQLLVIEGAKGARQRTVPIDQDSAPFLLGRLDHLLTVEGLGHDDHLWPTRPGGGSRLRRDRPVTPPSMHYWWVAQVAAAGVPYRKLHTTRHTYATRMRKLGLDLGDIQLLLGHASVGTTQRIYVHSDHEDVRKKIAALRATAGDSSSD